MSLAAAAIVVMLPCLVEGRLGESMTNATRNESQQPPSHWEPSASQLSVNSTLVNLARLDAQECCGRCDNYCSPVSGKCHSGKHKSYYKDCSQSRASGEHHEDSAGGKSGIKVINSCDKPMWIAHCCSYKYPQNVKVEPGQSHHFPAYPGLSGFRLWPKMECQGDGNGCLIGQSGGKGQPCGAGGDWKCAPHIDTKFEATFGSQHDYYDMSLVDGYTLPFKLRVKGCGAGSTSIDCSGLTLANCPAANREHWNGRVIGCHARGRPGHGSGEYVRTAHRMCPHTYAFDLDDKTGNRNCPSGTQYEITFMCL